MSKYIKNKSLVSQEQKELCDKWCKDGRLSKDFRIFLILMYYENNGKLDIEGRKTVLTPKYVKVVLSLLEELEKGNIQVAIDTFTLLGNKGAIG
jgi:hypothetical protein